MNKRFLILVGVVLCMILNLITPMKVNALEDGLVEETQIGEAPVPASLSNGEESVPKDEEEKSKDVPPKRTPAPSSTPSAKPLPAPMSSMKRGAT